MSAAVFAILVLLPLAVLVILGMVILAGGDSTTDYQYVRVTFENDDKRREREGWVEVASYVGEMMFFEWVEDDVDRWEIPQQHILELERSDWHEVEDTSELPENPLDQNR